MALIRLNQVEIEYPVLADHYLSLRRTLLRQVTGMRIYAQDARVERVRALKNVSLTLRDGDRVGIIGRNGAGKTTLLRTIGGFLLPVQGWREVSGRVTSLFGIGGGMDGDRTGYENIFFMGRLQGVSHRQMELHVPDIEDFCGLGNFLKLPMRTYSDGMKTRLCFAIATCLTPDILVMDEGIGAGDFHFVEKARQRALEMYSRANILVMASHSPHLLQSLCTQAIWLENGFIQESGPVDEVMERYSQSS